MKYLARRWSTSGLGSSGRWPYSIAGTDHGPAPVQTESSLPAPTRPMWPMSQEGQRITCERVHGAHLAHHRASLPIWHMDRVESSLVGRHPRGLHPGALNTVVLMTLHGPDTMLSDALPGPGRSQTSLVKGPSGPGNTMISLSRQTDTAAAQPGPTTRAGWCRPGATHRIHITHDSRRG